MSTVRFKVCLDLFFLSNLVAKVYFFNMSGYLKKLHGFCLLDNSDVNNHKHPVLTHDNNKFYCEKLHHTHMYWKCSKWRNGCRVRLTTNKDCTQLVSKWSDFNTPSHTHLPTWSKTHQDRAWCLRTLMCCKLDVTSRREFDEYSLGFPSVFISAFPKYHSVKRKILEMRAEKPPPTPSEVESMSTHTHTHTRRLLVFFHSCSQNLGRSFF